jgi:ABC-type multidrug transport system permease subunit
MTAIPNVIGDAGWTDFAAWFSTFFLLILVLIVLAWYTLVARRHP